MNATALHYTDAYGTGTAGGGGAPGRTRNLRARSWLGALGPANPSPWPQTNGAEQGERIPYTTRDPGPEGPGPTPTEPWTDMVAATEHEFPALGHGISIVAGPLALSAAQARDGGLAQRPRPPGNGSAGSSRQSGCGQAGASPGARRDGMDCGMA